MSIVKEQIKPSSIFFLTVPKCELSKDHVFSSFEDIFEELCVSQELHCDGTHHLHVFFKTSKPMFYNEVQDLLDVCFKVDEDNSYHYNLQNCKSRRNTLKYITKEDSDPRTKNISKHELSFYVQAIKWIDSCEMFDHCDPFVASHPQYYRYLEEMFNSRKAQTTKVELDVMGGCQEQKSFWALEVCHWWNDWMLEGWKHKKAQLFLHGPSNTGKSQLIRDLVGDGIHIYQPSPNSNFAWEDFDHRIHKVVVMEEFDSKLFNMSEWKQIVEGSTTKVNVKGKKGKYIKVQCPIIMISNLNVPDVIGFRERCKIVFADVNNY